MALGAWYSKNYVLTSKQGDTEGFKDILGGYLATVNKAALLRTTNLSRTTLFRMIEPDSNPTLENVAEIMRVLKAV